MAIRFPCPACRQPIEVDDTWGGQSVACPYCRNVITAPAASSWPAADVPMAAPAGGAFSAPPPPVTGFPHAPAVRRPASSQAGWALALSIGGALCTVIGYLGLITSMMIKVEARVGPNPTQDEVMRATQEVMSSGEGVTLSAGTATFFIVGIICCLAGLVLAIRSLLRQEPRRGMAIVACIIGACFAVCQIMPMASAIAWQMKSRDATSDRCRPTSPIPLRCLNPEGPCPTWSQGIAWTTATCPNDPADTDPPPLTHRAPAALSIALTLPFGFGRFGRVDGTQRNLPANSQQGPQSRLR